MGFPQTSKAKISLKSNFLHLPDVPHLNKMADLSSQYAIQVSILIVQIWKGTTAKVEVCQQLPWEMLSE